MAIPLMSSAVAVALKFIAYRSETSTEQPRVVKTSTAVVFAAELNELELWWAYTISTFFAARIKETLKLTQGIQDKNKYN